MGLVSKLLRSREQNVPGKELPRPTSARVSELADGAIDTLGTVIRTMGEASIPLDHDDPDRFASLCFDMARHVENGAAVPAQDITPMQDGSRQWQQVQRFFVDRRHAEAKFVGEKLGDYRGVVEDLMLGLRQIGQRDAETEHAVRQCFESIENAMTGGLLPDVRGAMKEAISNVEQTFAQQKQVYEQQIEELNKRMSSLRQDLSAVREEMKRDTLTNAYNRGAFDQAIAQFLNLGFMTGQSVTLVLIDLDHFKTINDTFGHATGDEVLRAVGETLERSFIRKNDFVARFGGDEFAVLLADTSAAQSAPIIGRFLDNLRKIEVSHRDWVGPVTCSAGYAESADTDDVRSFLERADRGLYAAKAAGRNCSRIASLQAIDQPDQTATI